jgi:ribose transport system ATP-binding protein
MVGRDVSQFFKREHTARTDRVRLELRDFCYQGVPGTPDGKSSPINLAVRAGEILGLAGLVGAGRTELAEALFGLRPHLSGEVLLDGERLAVQSPRQAMDAGLLLVPEDRRYHGLILRQDVEYNISLPNLDLLSWLTWVNRRKEQALAQDTCARLQVRTPSISQLVGLLSGGNQQKVVLGKWLARRPRVLILDEPTRGIDVGAKSEIYALMDRLAKEGVAIIMISSDMEEVLGMSDRVAVLYQGQLTGVLERSDLNEEAVMHLATGGKGSPAEEVEMRIQTKREMQP